MNEMMFRLPERWFKNEASFTTWFWKNIKDGGWFFHKISDADRWLKPFDALMAYKGKTYWIEFKFCKWNSCKPYNLLRWSSSKNPWSQVLWLQKYAANWGISLVIVYNHKYNIYKVFDFTDLSLDYKYEFNVQKTTRGEPI